MHIARETHIYYYYSSLYVLIRFSTIFLCASFASFSCASFDFSFSCLRCYVLLLALHSTTLHFFALYVISQHTHIYTQARIHLHAQHRRRNSSAAAAAVTLCYFAFVSTFIVYYALPYVFCTHTHTYIRRNARAVAADASSVVVHKCCRCLLYISAACASLLLLPLLSPTSLLLRHLSHETQRKFLALLFVCFFITLYFFIIYYVFLHTFI